MRVDTHAEITCMHHRARWAPSLELWVLVNQDKEIIATVGTSTADHVTEIVITLTPGGYSLQPRSFTRPSGERAAIRWVCQELNNDNLWLRARLSLEHEARLLGHSEPELLACWHATDYKYCQRLLTNLPRLLDRVTA